MVKLERTCERLQLHLRPHPAYERRRDHAHRPSSPRREPQMTSRKTCSSPQQSRGDHDLRIESLDSPIRLAIGCGGSGSSGERIARHARLSTDFDESSVGWQGSSWMTQIYSSPRRTRTPHIHMVTGKLGRDDSRARMDPSMSHVLVTIGR